MPKRKRFFRIATLLPALAAAAIGTHSSAFSQTFTVTPPSPGCQLLSAPAGTTPAFCDTFDKPEGTGDRSGALNGTVWGVSRFLGGINTGQNQYYDVSPTAIEMCGTTYSVIDPNDVQICDGQLVEAQFDQTGVTSLAMYPKQPFDISGGRTGTIAFDVSNDSHGGHSVWPELWYVDKPVPTPFVHDTSLISVPANGFGVQLAGTCPANSGGGCGARFVCPEYPESVPVVTIGAAWVINNYVSTEVDAFSSNPSSTFTVTPVECVQASSGPGNMNHFELRVSQNEIDVYGIDAGATGPLKKIAVIANAGLTITTGLVFMEDNHYNANKTSNGQGVHTFTWDNFAFDGPVLPRDLAFDVLDRLTPVGSGYPGLLNAGWGFGGFDQSPPPPPLTLTVPGMYNVADATAAFLTFNFVDFNYANLLTPDPFISYSVNNGSPQLAPFPFGACTIQNGGPACGEYTIAVPVNLSDLVTGTNTITLTATDGAAIANVDLILHSAGGIPCTTNCPATLPVPTLTIAPSASSITNAQGLTVAVTVAGSGTPVPSGTVMLSEVGFTSAPITLSGGKATISIPAGMLPAGPDLLTVSYSGDANYAFASNNSSVNVSSVAPVAGNASLELSPSAYPGITTAQPLTLLVDLFGSGFLAPLTVTGTVTVTGGGYNSGAIPLSGGLATISIPAGGLEVGDDTFAVNYSGDSNYAASDYTDQLTITVTSSGTTSAALTTPTPSTELGSSANFTWSAGSGVTAYWLTVGTGPSGVNAKNLYAGGPTSALSAMVTGLPTYGLPIYATLSSEIGGVWQSTVYTFTASGSPVAAALLSPSPGGQFASTNVTFTWNAGSGATNYWLDLGTASSGANAKNIYSSGPVTALTETVTGLPTNGETIYATLYSYYSGAYQPTVYTFHATGPAVLIAPSPGSKLGSSATFTWTPGSGITHYWFNLGTADAGMNAKNIYSGGSTTATSVTVSDLPANSETLYATLYSWISGAWQPIVYTYTAAGTPTAAALKTPAPSTKLAGATVTFSWTPGEGVTNYWFNVGTANEGANAKNIYSGGSTTATSVTVSGLPTNGETIYATLSSYIAGVWQSTVYTYTAQ